MTSPAMKLDKLAYSKKLIEVGCEPKLAEAHASLQQEMLIEISEDYLSQFATKQDLEAHSLMTKKDLETHSLMTKKDLETHNLMTKRDLEAHRAETKRDLEAHRAETKRDIMEIKHDLDELRIETKQGFAMIRQEMQTLFYRTVITLGSIVFAAITISIAILKIHF